MRFTSTLHALRDTTLSVSVQVGRSPFCVDVQRRSGPSTRSAVASWPSRSPSSVQPPQYPAVVPRRSLLTVFATAIILTALDERGFNGKHAISSSMRGKCTRESRMACETSRRFEDHSIFVKVVRETNAPLRERLDSITDGFSSSEVFVTREFTFLNDAINILSKLRDKRSKRYYDPSVPRKIAQVKILLPHLANLAIDI